MRPATPLPLAMEETVVVWVVESHSSCRTSSRRLIFLRAGSGVEGRSGAGGGYAPDEVELDDGLPCRTLLVEVEGREGELEVWARGERRRRGGREKKYRLLRVVLLPDSAWPGGSCRRRRGERSGGRTEEENLDGLLAAVVGLPRLSYLVVYLPRDACGLVLAPQADDAVVGGLVRRGLEGGRERVVGVGGRPEGSRGHGGAGRGRGG